MRSSQNQRQRGHHFRQRGMLLVHPHVQFLEIAHASAGVREFINGYGLTFRCPTRKERHQGNKEDRGEEKSSRCFQFR
jgi:hypothetical protein